MKAIILAAGQGSRLRPLTDNKPKCMVEYNKKPIIDYILEIIEDCGINNIAIVGGYKQEVLQKHLKNKEIKFYTNEKFDKTNMVHTLFCAEDWIDQDIIISYADIIYKKEILQKLIESNADISVVVDKEWQKLWELRMENPLSDAETMKLDENNNIIELGKKPQSLIDIEGQYIGLIKISKNVIQKVKSFYQNLNKTALYDGKNFENMYMTSFIQLIIDKLMPVKAVFVNQGWIEIDNLQDLKVYESNKILIEKI